ncbi:aminoglycoside phosphotransferase family protein [Nocardia farcinica]|uniref:aminoglycoside phosphotransferase family protein n=1 Tax=Nocardia farcinica TaxID=37329 RepID=UPI0018943AAB|nr:aminoglycoside phosphotransferase family protein [Nocardia farcinica]MBF6294208.1 aminoglycoside phosphotransferase family protein [Nocardia farcinica]MBF6381050.1 aminoglycoside phosphotransferase family protein [Nocardia farcinica]
MTADSGLPGRAALEDVCGAQGLSTQNARLLHRRSNAVWLVEDVVVRLAPNTPLRRTRAATSIGVTRWLETTATEPIALAPLPVDQPILTGDAVATLWPYRPTDYRPRTADLARLVRRLHAQPAPPVPLPEYRPLHRLREALDIDAARAAPALDPDDRAWLRCRATDLVARFDATHFPLGRGLVHADAHTENVVRDGADWKLIDWDNACSGPRELDLAATLPDHFHTPAADRTEFVTAYGYDPLEWPDWTVLRDIVELGSLGSYIRLAPTCPPAAHELRRRLASLRTGDRGVVWKPVG